MARRRALRAKGNTSPRAGRHVRTSRRSRRPDDCKGCGAVVRRQQPPGDPDVAEALAGSDVGLRRKGSPTRCCLPRARHRSRRSSVPSSAVMRPRAQGSPHASARVRDRSLCCACACRSGFRRCRPTHGSGRADGRWRRSGPGAPSFSYIVGRFHQEFFSRWCRRGASEQRPRAAGRAHRPGRCTPG
jgi:hypothetical protein